MRLFGAYALALLLLLGCAASQRRQRDYGPENALKMLADVEKRSGDAAYAVTFYPVILEALGESGDGPEIRDSKEQLARLQSALAKAQALKPVIEAWQKKPLPKEEDPAWVQDLGRALEPWNDAIAGFSKAQKSFQARYRGVGIRNEDVNVLHYDAAHVALQMEAEEKAMQAVKGCAASEAESGALAQALELCRRDKKSLDGLRPGLAVSKAVPSFMALKPQDPKFLAYKAALQALKQSLKAHRAQKAKFMQALESCS